MPVLRYSPTSPYARKTIACAIEAGLDGEITLLGTNPWAAESDIRTVNPLAKVPTLILDDGSVLYDSRVICEWLDHRSGGKLIPGPGPARWVALRAQALADGINDAAIARRLELTQRTPERQDPAVLARYKAAVDAGLDALEREIGARAAEPLSVAHVAIGAALGYLDFRFAHEPWAPTRPALAAWWTTFAKRPAMQRTAPPPA